jgi:hypothetical protein
MLRRAAVLACGYVWIAALVTLAPLSAVDRPEGRTLVEEDTSPASLPHQAHAAGLLKPPLQRPKVVFHDPVSDESGVSISTSIRVQFSRHMIPETFSEHVRVSYVSPRSLTSPPIPQFTATYRLDTRSITITFAAPLERYQTVKVELLEGICAVSGLPLPPWSYSFTTGS